MSYLKKSVFGGHKSYKIQKPFVREMLLFFHIRGWYLC